MWRFSVAEERWNRYQITTRPSKEDAGDAAANADTADAISSRLWAAPRESASLTNGGLMFGGVTATMLFGDGHTAATECLGSSSSSSATPLLSPYRMLSGLWKWRDGAGAVLYQ